MESKRIILDTSAILTYFEGEEGKETVEIFLKRSASNEIELFIPFSAAIEFYYINFNSQGEETANQRFAMLMSLPVKVLKSIDEPYIIQAGRLKSSYPISFADALIAAYAYLEKASLVHKDPEYLTLENEINLITLPLKIS
ncbi:MAG: type II toxin-antitoxin system VapC family toxin [Actinobacteria bacterium]|nr:type II toxin-antitoxin system VapC family toxin [Actinomycetota bacterium]